MAAALNGCEVEAAAVEYLEAAGRTMAAAMACSADIARAVALLRACVTQGRTVYFCGNGGSAAEAQHLAAELMGQMGVTRPPIRAVALTTDTSFLTAWANDTSFTDVFARQVAGLGLPGDVLVALSTSGTSANITAALTQARTGFLGTILLTGADCPAAPADVVIRVPSSDTQHLQEAHLAIGHLLCRMTEAA